MGEVMYQALYRKYRPKTFSSVIAQDVVKRILINSIKNDKISHAYLFSGSRGIGKTSIAKIFAKAVNCLNFHEHDDVCLECENCKEADSSVDIIEIDAASNNGVEQIRELKSKVNIVPSKMKYKVYIIDEVHMLSNSAFNALLKTLEEPPSHVIFILATTEFFEVPDTIVSRCQCYSFSRITNEQLQSRLNFICDKEKIQTSDEVLKMIAESANGGLRDAISMLDKLASFSNNKIEVEDFIKLNGLVSTSDIEATYDSLISGDYAAIIDTLNKINENGYNFENFVERLMTLCRDKVVNNYIDGANKNIQNELYIIQKLNELLNVLKTTLTPLIMIQVYLLQIVSYLHDETNVSHEIRINSSKKESEPIKNTSNNATTPVSSKVSPLCSVNEKIKNIRVNNALAHANLAFKKEFLEQWGNLQKYRFDDTFAYIVQLLDLSTPMIVSDEYVLMTCNSEGVVERMFSCYQEIEKLLVKIYNHNYKVVFVTTKDFENIKNKYIKNKKNGIIYTYQVENEKLLTNTENDKNDLLSKALSVFGSELVDVEDDE